MTQPPTIPPEEDDDFEYEVEPVDEQVTAHFERRAKEELKRAEQAIDVDSIYRELNRRDDFDAAFESFKARFSIRTLLIATTVIALLLGFGASGLLTGATFAGFICLSLIVLGSIHGWLSYQERKRHAELVALREAQLRGTRGPNDDGDDEDAASGPRPAMVTPADLLRELFRFGLKDFLIAGVAASFMVAICALTGSPGKGAAALGAVAITGLAMQAADINIPRPLVLAFWLSLAGFCLLTIASLGTA